MPRLPTPGSDSNQWGVLLNEFLRVSHQEDGTLRCVPVDILSFASVDRGGDIGYRHEGTIQEALNKVGNNETTICLSEGIWHIQADLVIPDNTTLYILRGGVLKIYDGVMLRIQGRIETGIYQIFDYIGSGQVVWSYHGTEFGSRQELYPEWWGAVAAEVQNVQYAQKNNVAFNRMFAVPGTGHHPRRARLQPGAVYNVSETIRIMEWFHVFGERAQIRSSLSIPGSAAVQIGSRAENKKVFYMEWRGVDVHYNDSPLSSAVGILIDHSDFGVIHNCVVAGWDVGVKSGVGSVNEWTFRNTLVSGCRIGYAMGQRPNNATPSVSTWEGGKIQQCTELGMHLANMTQFELRALDLSLNGQGSIKIENCSSFQISVYTELVGISDSQSLGTLNNEWKNIHLIGCNAWSIEHCTLIGALRKNYDPAYGIYVEGQSKNGQITNNTFVRHRKAVIYIGPECRNITESNNEQQDNADEFPGTINVIDESAEGELVRLTGGIHEVIRRIPNRVAKLQNFIVASHDFTDATNWYTPPDADPVAVIGTVSGPDGVTPAQILQFSSVNSVPVMETLSKPIPGLEGKTIILEWFHKIIATNPASTGIGYPQIRVLMFRNGPPPTFSDGLHRVGLPGTDWIFNRREWTVARDGISDERIRIIMYNRTLDENLQLAMAGMCLRVRGESACYYPKFERVGAIDRSGHGQALPGLQVLAYGGQAIRIFVAEANPQELNLTPPVGATQWEVGDRCLNSNPTPGGASGWVCTTAGTPGVWKTFGTIEQ